MDGVDLVKDYWLTAVSGLAACDYRAILSVFKGVVIYVEKDNQSLIVTGFVFCFDQSRELTMCSHGFVT